MRVLGVDPGLSNVGWCLVDEPALRPSRFDGPARASGRRRLAFGWLTASTEVIVWRADTIRVPTQASDGRAVPIDRARWAAAAVGDLCVRFKPDRLAVEGFEHRPWLGRRVSTSPEMGRLVGLLESLPAMAGRIVVVPAGDSKRGQDFARRWHRNSHEWSAWCVAQYASSRTAVIGAV